MKYTIRAKSAEDTSPLVIATEDPIEVLESVRSFREASMTAQIVDEMGKPLALSEVEQVAERSAELLPARNEISVNAKG